MEQDGGWFDLEEGAGAAASFAPVSRRRRCELSKVTEERAITPVRMDASQRGALACSGDNLARALAWRLSSNVASSRSKRSWIGVSRDVNANVASLGNSSRHFGRNPAAKAPVCVVSGREARLRHDRRISRAAWLSAGLVDATEGRSTSPRRQKP
jgi:hypothetical protein